ncbi:MAG: hypothetical protein WCC22_20840 [Terriglobales bacterium]
MRKCQKFLFVVCCLALTTLAFAKTNQNKTQAPTVRHPIRFAISPPMFAVPQSIRSEEKVEHEVRSINRNLGPGAPDTAVQTEFGPLLNGTPGIDFEGIGVNGSEPSDVNMAVGPNHIVQIVNSEWAVYDKTGLIAAGFPKTLGSIWTSLGGPCTGEQGDPIAQYDRLADRWFLSQIGSESAPFSLCIAVSKTNDPTGAYSLYEYSFGNNFPDYPKYSVWPTATNPAYLQMAHLFLNLQSFVGTAACAYDRTAMVAGNPSPVQICFTISNDGGFLPSDLDGSTAPPDGSPGYFITFETTSLHQFQLTPDFANPGSSTFTGPINIPVSAFTAACGGGGTCIPQSGTVQQLDSLADRMMYRLAYRNFGDHEAMVVNHSVTSGSSVGPRWYEIRTPNNTPTIFQQGTYAPDSTFRWMGSMAMDQAGDMLMSYSVSSSSIDPGIAYTGRVPADALGTMESENILLTGTHFQTGHSRWGDYSAARIDPADDCTFWFTNQYLTSNGDFVWGTHIGSFAFTGCAADFTVGASPSSLTILQGANGTSTITVASLSGFNSAVTLSASGLPSGVTAAFAPNPVTPPAGGNVTSTLTLTASGDATTGTATVTVTGTSGSLVHTTTITLTVNPDFTLTNTGVTSQTVLAGVPATGYAFTVAPVAPGTTFGGAVTLSCSGLDSTTSCNFSLNPIPAGAAATDETLTITTSGPNVAPVKPQQRRRADNRTPWLPLTLPIAGVVMVGLTRRKVSRYSAIAAAFLALALLGLLIACGSSANVTVGVSPSSASLWPNGPVGHGWPSSTQAFTATVGGTKNPGVTWAISPSTAGSIDANGNYTAPTIAAGLPASVTVTATSQADSRKSASATVTLKPATVPGVFNVTVTATEAGTPPTTHPLSPVLTMTVQ